MSQENVEVVLKVWENSTRDAGDAGVVPPRPRAC
jgi:hypothetical protein